LRFDLSNEVGLESVDPPKPVKEERRVGRIYDATWGRAFSAVYDRGFKATEEAGLREMRRELLTQARGRVLELGAGPASTSSTIRRASRA
jgi:hypothetical protein